MLAVVYTSPGNCLDPSAADRLPDDLTAADDGSFLVTAVRDWRAGGRA